MNDVTQTDENPYETDAATVPGLWEGDTGVLGEQQRRALLELIKGPYLSGVKSPALWSALLADEAGIRSRLDELFLELVLDRVGEFAFVRNVSTTQLMVPSAVRSAALTFLDTAMLLVLRQMLLAGEAESKVGLSSAATTCSSNCACIAPPTATKATSPGG